MACLQTQIVAFVFEHRAHVCAFKLGVLVIGAAEPAFDRLQQAA
jgi:hypothetical protein